MNAPEKVVFVNPEELVSCIVQECKANRDEAVERVMDELRKNKDFYAAVVEPMLRTAARSLVDEAIRHENKKILGETKYIPQDKAMGRIIEKRVVSIYDFAMPGNKTLGECTRADLTKAADIQRKCASTIMVNVRWWEMLAEKLKNDTAFVSTISVKVVEELRAKAEEAVQ